MVGRGAALGRLVTLGIAISFLARFNIGHSGLQFVTDKVWIGALGIHYKLGLDGLNVVLVLLTTVLFSASLIWASFREWDRPRLFYFHFGLAESAVLGAFCAQDLALFVGVLRPDADPVLLPDRDVGHGRPGPGHHQARRLHARRLVLHARRRRSRPACSPRASTARR